MASSLWFFQALAAAVLWGFGYALSERVLKQGVSPAFLVFLSGVLTLPVYLFTASWMGKLRPGIQVVLAEPRLFGMAVVVALCIAAGNLLIFTSVSMKNATLANMVEIAYPLFTFVFAWLLFREAQLNASTALGGVLVLCGVALIFLKS